MLIAYMHSKTKYKYLPTMFFFNNQGVSKGYISGIASEKKVQTYLEQKVFKKQ